MLPAYAGRMDSGLRREIEQKVRAGGRLSHDDGVALYACDDLAWLGGLAHEVRIAKNGDSVVFDVNRFLSMTGDCSAPCGDCASPGDGDARIEELVRAARSLGSDGLTELHIVNGRHPDLAWSFYPRSLRALKEALPDVSLKAFTATEIHWFEQVSGLSADEILDQLIDAGLDSLTGGGAEIFDQEIRQQLVDHDTHWEDWSRIHRLAHSKGLKTPATMLYGHVEEPRHRVDHVLRLRDLQDETGGFQVFLPLLDRVEGRARTVTPAESLTTFAVSRLLFDNVPHVRCLWGMYGSSLAQLSLNFGVDDLGGAVVDHEVTEDDARRGAPDAMRRDDLLDLIRDAGFTPVERNGRFEAVRRYDGPTPLAERRREPQPMWS